MLLAMLSIAANIGAADRVEMNKNGLLRVAQSAEEWRQTGVTVTLEAQKYPAEWQRVFKNPDAIVPIETSIKFSAMRDLVHQQRDTVLELGIGMTKKDGKKVIDVVKGEGRVIQSETSYNSYIFLWTAAMLYMTWACWLIWRGKDGEKDYATGIAIAAAIATFTLAFIASAIATFIAAIVAYIGGSKKVYGALVAVFYVAMIISLIAFYA